METKGAQPESGQSQPRRRGPSLFAWLSLGASVVIGVAAGIGGFTFAYAKGGSYMTDNPAACANCHIMQDQYAGWSKSSHHAVAVCNDCHTQLGGGDLIKGFEQMNHMPYKREGALKISDHHVRSPLLNVNRACQTCHNWTEDELMQRVNTIQDRTFELRNRALDAMVALIGDMKAARAAGKTDADLKTAMDLQRRAQFMVDFVEAENSMGFHAPEEAARILGIAMDLARQGQLAVRQPDYQPISFPAPPGVKPTPREVTPPPGSSTGGSGH